MRLLLVLLSDYRLNQLNSADNINSAACSFVLRCVFCAERMSLLQKINIKNGLLRLILYNGLTAK
jgi:hypothetical protein